eukprot:4021694-Amphidinium_carterae.1
MARAGRKACTNVLHTALTPIFRAHIKEPDFTTYGKGKLDKKEILRHKAMIRACLALSPSLSFRVSTLTKGLQESAACAWWGTESWVSRWSVESAKKLLRMFRHAAQAILKTRLRGFRQSWVNQLLGSECVEGASANPCLEVILLVSTSACARTGGGAMAGGKKVSTLSHDVHIHHLTGSSKSEKSQACMCIEPRAHCKGVEAMCVRHAGQTRKGRWPRGHSCMEVWIASIVAVGNTAEDEQANAEYSKAYCQAKALAKKEGESEEAIKEKAQTAGLRASAEYRAKVLAEAGEYDDGDATGLTLCTVGAATRKLRITTKTPPEKKGIQEEEDEDEDEEEEEASEDCCDESEEGSGTTNEE